LMNWWDLNVGEGNVVQTEVTWHRTSFRCDYYALWWRIALLLANSSSVFNGCPFELFYLPRLSPKCYESYHKYNLVFLTNAFQLRSSWPISWCHIFFATTVHVPDTDRTSFDIFLHTLFLIMFPRENTFCYTLFGLGIHLYLILLDHKDIFFVLNCVEQGTSCNT
jgi:hypothetical protein